MLKLYYSLNTGPNRGMLRRSRCALTFFSIIPPIIRTVVQSARVVVVVDLHIQRIVLATEETAVT